MLEMMISANSKTVIPPGPGLTYDQFLTWLSSQSGVVTKLYNTTLGQANAKIRTVMPKGTSWSTMWGSSWGTILTYDSQLLAPILHAHPSKAVYDDNLGNSRTVYFEYIFLGASKTPYLSVTRNGYTSSPYSAGFQGGYIGKIIYFDYTKNCMMTTNPESSLTPVPFTG